MHQELLGMGVGGNSRKGVFYVRLVKFFRNIQDSVNILPERKFIIFVSTRMRKSENVESPGFPTQLASLRKASLLIEFEQSSF